MYPILNKIYRKTGSILHIFPFLISPLKPILTFFGVKDGKIEAIEVTSAEKEDGAYLAMAEDIIPKIIEAQSAEVDTISGATFSSTGIKNAAEKALEQAVK